MKQIRYQVIITDSNNKIWKIKNYYNLKSFELWAPKIFKKFVELGNKVESFKSLGAGWELIERKGSHYEN